MAKNKPYGDNSRIGAIKNRTQVHNPKNDTWIKRDSESGKFMSIKNDKTPYKGVTKEK